MQHNILVIGAGAWGTALAIHTNQKGINTFLWGRNAEKIKAMTATRKKSNGNIDFAIPKNITLCADFKSLPNMLDAIIIATPSKALAAVLDQIKHLIKTHTLIIIACKGMMLKADLSPLTSIDFVGSILGGNYPIALLAGPNFAQEIAQGQPAAAVIASAHEDTAAKVINLLSNNHLRLYINQDVLGVQIAGALKNPLAVAAGISDALQLGLNARSSLITRGLAEMMQFGLALGAKQQTFLGLAGIGDLMLTATGDLSRNRRLGLALGKDLSIEAACEQIGQVIESLDNVHRIVQCAQAYQIRVPIIEQVARIIKKDASVQQAMHHLLTHRSDMHEF